MIRIRRLLIAGLMVAAGLALSTAGASAQTFNGDAVAASFNGGVGAQPVGSYHVVVDVGTGTISIVANSGVNTPGVPGVAAPVGTLSPADVNQVTITFFTGLNCGGSSIETFTASGITTGGLPWSPPAINPDGNYSVQSQAAPPPQNNILADGTNSFSGNFALIGGSPQSIAVALTGVSSRQWSGCINTSSVVPEPASLSLLSGALLPVGLMIRRRRWGK